jgi:hypothetical protein
MLKLIGVDKSLTAQLLNVFKKEKCTYLIDKMVAGN